MLIPVLILGALGAVFGAGLAVAAKKFRVDIDPRLEKIHGLLPGSNCGACGGAGCFGFAEGLLSGKFEPGACRVSEEAVQEQIARLLGKPHARRVRKVAALHCGGGTRVGDKFVYGGALDCVSAYLVMGGQKECSYACVGFGTCARVCPSGAITMADDGLPVVDPARCTACNKCVAACPKKLFTLVPVTHPVYVACNSHDSGKDTRLVCPVGCIACGMCVKACAFDAIHVIGNLAAIDYGKCTSCTACVKVCPMKTIRIRGGRV